jgi:hypothetical protein
MRKKLRRNEVKYVSKGALIGQGNTAEIFDYGEGKVLKLYREEKRLLRIYLAEYFKITQADRKNLLRWKLPIAAARLSEWRPEPEKKRLLKMVHQSI